MPRHLAGSGGALDAALAGIAAGAAARDRAAPAFPEEAFRALEGAGALDGDPPGGHAGEWGLLRRVARADGSVARILDGHLNGRQRILALAPGPLRGEETVALARGLRRYGVWGADPAEGEGPPARLDRAAGVLRGVKVFCSGAGGVDRALVTARDGDGPPALCCVDVTRGVQIDRGWYRGPGLRTSESHRVAFDGARVAAVLGGPGELVREPWFSRDAIRTAACWAGLADALAEATLDGLAEAAAPGDLGALAAGRIAGAVAAIDRWLGAAAPRADDPSADMRAESVHLRAAIAGACRTVVDESARALGSRPLAAGGDLDRCRRDLDLFLLQHRLDPMVARVGREALARRRP